MPSEPPGVVSLQEWLQESVRINLQSLMMFGDSKNKLEKLEHLVGFIIRIHIYYIYIYIYIYIYRGPCSSVRIATDYGLDGLGSNPGGDDIFHPSRPALWPTPTSCKMGAGSFPGVKYGRGVLLTTHTLLVLRSWKSRATWYTSTHPLVHTGPVTGSLYLYIYIYIYIYIPKTDIYLTAVTGNCTYMDMGFAAEDSNLLAFYTVPPGLGLAVHS